MRKVIKFKVVCRLRRFSGWSVLLLLATACAAVVEQPNFLFILVDDLGCRDLGVEGSTFHETPNIDALAESGMRFENGYAACQVCSPSRASIMLGKAPPRHGITQWIGDPSGLGWNKGDPVMNVEYTRSLPHADTTLAEALRAGGYATFFAGKWHLGSKGSWPQDHGFDINKGGWDSGSPKGGYFSPWKNPSLENGPNGESLTMRLARETADYIAQKHERPFLAFLSFYTVHSPIQTTEALWKKYRRKAVAAGLAGDASRFTFDRRQAVRQVQDNPVYAGMMEMLDDAVGLVLEQLKVSGLESNTVVIFTSDNGGVSSGDAYSTSLLPLRGGKGRQWEGGVREPFFIRAPGVTTPGTTTTVPAIGMDFFPTMLELAGLDPLPEQHVDGVSLVPVLKGGTLAERDLFWHYPHYGNQGGEPSSMIRSGAWKLIYYHEDGRYELYNLDQDVGEQHDLASAHPERVDALRKRLDVWLSDTGARMPRPDPRFDEARFEARLNRARTQLMNKLEDNHQYYLDEAYSPQNGWWGSAIESCDNSGRMK